MDDSQLSQRLPASNNLQWAIFNRIRDPWYNLRSGSRFRWVSSQLCSPLFPNYASVHPLNNNTVALHSLAPPPVRLQPTTDFWAVLRGYNDQSLWDNFDCDGDGSWYHHLPRSEGDDR